mmetsp:Transcript_3815/g.11439  ORF Transcript_3815/g.11439 Transcript_3815/m.11439 type:complete len:202 (-) Transcript_3815:370-975(-)
MLCKSSRQMPIWSPLKFLATTTSKKLMRVAVLSISCQGLTAWPPRFQSPEAWFQVPQCRVTFTVFFASSSSGRSRVSMVVDVFPSVGLYRYTCTDTLPFGSSRKIMPSALMSTFHSPFSMPFRPCSAMVRRGGAHRVESDSCQTTCSLDLADGDEHDGKLESDSALPFSNNKAVYCGPSEASPTSARHARPRTRVTPTKCL